LLARVFSVALFGIEAYRVGVEVDVRSGLPGFATVGLPDTAVKESRERIKSAIKNSGFQFPTQKIVVNLTPAHLKKEGSSFDLPIAVGILCAEGIVSRNIIEDYLLVGELSLDGEVRPVAGILPMTTAAKQTGVKGMLVPARNAGEAAIDRNLNVFPVQNLHETVMFLNGEKEIKNRTGCCVVDEDTAAPEDILDYRDVKAQYQTKRAMEIAAAGGHNLIMIGPPGSGKTMIARRIISILPRMSEDELLATTKIHSVAGSLMKGGREIMRQRPFRMPHHTISYVGFTGGGSTPRPGEISLANNGVLFLDELPEFPRNILEALRQPLEERCIRISRAAYAVAYPANFIFIAAMNPCPCGFFTAKDHACRCTPFQIRKYLNKISGPLLDRIDLHIDVPRVSFVSLISKKQEEASDVIRGRVCTAREMQAIRFRRGGIVTNAEMTGKMINEFCYLSKDPAALMAAAMKSFKLSARAYDRIRKVARTIADLEGASEIRSHHVSEAIQYRSLDRQLWMDA